MLLLSRAKTFAHVQSILGDLLTNLILSLISVGKLFPKIILNFWKGIFIRRLWYSSKKYLYLYEIRHCRVFHVAFEASASRVLAARGLAVTALAV